MVGFFHSTENERSMGRLLAFMSACMGGLVIVYGGIFRDIAAIGIGAGLFGVGDFLKGWQKRAEK
ncbi:hypothetical protein LCGC14_2656380 [marine sediment metagenome]|uniref:Uncharacterized protein n=1 Tax=marine sediment metagenome TaxID=412755 RepID=A0A0F8ZTE4_9ZZZZ